MIPSFFGKFVVNTMLAMQVPMPAEGQSAYAWVAFIIALALAGLFAEYIRTRNKHDDRSEATTKEWKEIAQSAVKNFEANTTQLAKNTDAVEHFGQRLERIEDHLFDEPRHRAVTRRGS